jgi:hypothetical protein
MCILHVLPLWHSGWREKGSRKGLRHVIECPAYLKVWSIMMKQSVKQAAESFRSNHIIIMTPNSTYQKCNPATQASNAAPGQEYSATLHPFQKHPEEAKPPANVPHVSSKQTPKTTILGLLNLRPFASLCLAISLLRILRIQWLRSIIPHAFYNSKPFSPSLSKQQSITRSKILWSLHEPKRDGCSVARSDVRTVNVDDCTCLGHGSYVQHGLVFCFNGGCV